MTNISDDKKAIVKKPSSPFNNDPYNNRGGKGGNKTGFIDNKGHKMKSIRAPKFKSGGSGDR